MKRCGQEERARRTNGDAAIDNLANGLHGLFDAWKATDCYSGREDRRELDCRCLVSFRSLICHPVNSPCVTIPSVPSAPINSLVRSYPADDFLQISDESPAPGIMSHKDDSP